MLCFLKNEFYKEEKLYIKSIKNCVFIAKTGDRYTFACKIKDRGKCDYFYAANSGFIDKTNGGRRLYLCEGAEKKLLAAVRRADAALKKPPKVKKQKGKDRIGFFARLFGLRVLPALPKEFDRNYFVDSDTIDAGTLRRSGYTVVHRPYFAMIKSTHDAWTLNPHTKYGVDAAKTDDPTISFKDYLELFDEKK